MKLFGTTQYHTSKYVFYLDISESDVSEANNTSKVTVKAKLTLKNWGWVDLLENYKGTIGIDETVYDFEVIPDFPVYAGEKTYTLATKEKTVVHDEDGKKKCRVSARWNPDDPFYSPGICRASGDITLAAISQEIETNL